MYRFAWLVAVLLLSACGSIEYRDTSAAVDANPLCASRPDQPNEPVSRDCERKQDATWSTERKRDAAPLDFSGKRKDD
jgi:hypothetical protein